MNERALQALEYPRIKEMLAERTVSESGRKLAEKHGPSGDARRVRALLTETEEALKLLDSGASVPLSAMEGIEPFFVLLGKGVIFSESDLSHLASWLSAVAQMKRYMATKKATAPTISGYAESLYDCPELRAELERCLRYGKLTDHASPELAKIRRQLAVQEENVRRRLEQAGSKYKSYLQESIVSKRNGHYVLAVRECRKSVPGTVWDESASGQTLFVEPSDVAALQAEWELWKADEGREETRILAVLSEQAEEAAPSLQLNLEAMATFDFIFARGKLAQAVGGRPVALADEPLIRLRDARHPLLGRDAVPLNVEIGGDFRQLMITGPNTGGKTVALKTLGLSALMVQSGLLVPAGEESRFGVFTHIFADVGDGQSISQSLSTFSAHISAVTEMLKEADERSLLLLDELAAGTDPGEGIALSLAILEDLLAKGSLVAATTHFNEIKRFAARTPGCRNARMAFDAETLQPLYRLEMNEAGDSNALAIARKYGLPERVVKRAEERLAARTAAGGRSGGDVGDGGGSGGGSGNGDGGRRSGDGIGGGRSGNSDGSGSGNGDGGRRSGDGIGGGRSDSGNSDSSGSGNGDGGRRSGDGIGGGRSGNGNGDGDGVGVGDDCGGSGYGGGNGNDTGGGRGSGGCGENGNSNGEGGGRDGGKESNGFDAAQEGGGSQTGLESADPEEEKLTPYIGAGGKYAAGNLGRGGAEGSGRPRRAGASSLSLKEGELGHDEAKPKRPLQVGDAVWIHPLKRTGIVFRTANERGEVVVQVQKQKLTFNRKRLSLHIPREELYPGDDYDLDIVFESVANRKARKLMSRKHAEGVAIVKPPEPWED